MLYRIDHLTQAGTVPVSDFLGPLLLRSYKRALEVARETAATDADSCAQISRIGEGGHMSIAADVYPDGLVVRPKRNR